MPDFIVATMTKRCFYVRGENEVTKWRIQNPLQRGGNKEYKEPKVWVSGCGGVAADALMYIYFML